MATLTRSVQLKLQEEEELQNQINRLQKQLSSFSEEDTSAFDLSYIKQELEERSIASYTESCKQGLVEGTAKENTDSNRENEALPVAVENESLDNLRSMIERLGHLTGIKIDEHDQVKADQSNLMSLWVMKGRTFVGDLGFEVEIEVDEKLWLIQSLHIKVCRELEHELSSLLDICQEQKSIPTFTKCFSKYGKIFEERRRLFRRLKRDYPSLVRVAADVDGTSLSDDRILESETILYIEPDGGKLHAKLEWRAEFSRDHANNERFEFHNKLSFKIEPQVPVNDSELIDSQTVEKHFQVLVRLYGVEKTLDILIKILQ
mmetsp:Transcript_14245/g.18671  ORF Transcript_14245/g.18671 Transcript_14245/m.18671 type:complete len:318 (+) Transcript_14245:126-1079(+)